MSGKLDGAQVAGVEGFTGLDELDKALPRNPVHSKIRVRISWVTLQGNFEVQVMEIKKTYKGISSFVSCIYCLPLHPPLTFYQNTYVSIELAINFRKQTHKPSINHL